MKATFFEYFKRAISWNKPIEVYSNDTDNAYPDRMDRLISNSVTAKSAANIMVQYLLGKGYTAEIDGLIVNKDKNLTLRDFADDVAEDLVKQRGVFIHVNWNALYQISDMVVLPFDWCRVGKKDSKNYNGKIAIYNDGWTNPKKANIEWIDVFNHRKKVIDAQVEAAGGWESYKGQVLFINLDSKLIYPLSIIDSVAKDCDSEAQAAIYKNQLLRKGFFGNTLVIRRPIENIEEGKAMDKAIEDSLGAENAGGVLCLEMEFAGEKLEDAILIKQIDSKMDDKLFNYTESSVRENILVAFNNLPAGLVKTSDNSLFGNSGEAILEMKRTYWENTTKERNALTAIINKLLSKSASYSGITVEPIKLIEDAITNNEG